jgi:hypothetical protein
MPPTAQDYHADDGYDYSPAKEPQAGAQECAVSLYIYIRPLAQWNEYTYLI